MPDERFSGTLKTYDPIKGYGFISREKGKDVFVYFDEFKSKDGDAGAIAGCQVEYSIEERKKGPLARNVQIVG